MSGEYAFTAELWEYGAEASWFFVTVPEQDSDEIAELAERRPGFGSVRVRVTVGTSDWSTSLFPSKELSAYILPVKRRIREREAISAGDLVRVELILID